MLILSSEELRQLLDNNFDFLENINFNNYDKVCGIYNNEKLVLLSLKDNKIFCINAKKKDEKLEKTFLSNIK